MDSKIILVICLSFLINLITTLSYSVRIVGIRTGRIAVSFALFNILVLISRTANGFQAPLLANTIETNINSGAGPDLLNFRLIILSCTVASIIGGLMIPTFQRILSIAVERFSVYKSVPKVLFHGFTKTGATSIKDPVKVFIMNVVAVAIVTIGVLSALYAGYFTPEYRSTASNLSAIINGMATILMFVFIDPFLSVMTDEVVLGKARESLFRKYIVYMVIARVVGTLIAQVMFVPAAKLISIVAGMI
jgi:hypothetical protein